MTQGDVRFALVVQLFVKFRAGLLQRVEPFGQIRHRTKIWPRTKARAGDTGTGNFLDRCQFAHHHDIHRKTYLANDLFDQGKIGQPRNEIASA